MSQLRQKARKGANLYYPRPKTLYEQFINKKWTERRDICERPSSFIKVANESWKTSNDAERQKFMSASPPPPSKNRIQSFFKPIRSDESKTKRPSSSSSTTCSSSSKESIEREGDLPKNFYKKAPSTTANASCAIENRETFLSDKECQMIKNFN